MKVDGGLPCCHMRLRNVGQALLFAVTHEFAIEKIHHDFRPLCSNTGSTASRESRRDYSRNIPCPRKKLSLITPFTFNQNNTRTYYVHDPRIVLASLAGLVDVLPLFFGLSVPAE